MVRRSLFILLFSLLTVPASAQDEGADDGYVEADEAEAADYEESPAPAPLLSDEQADVEEEAEDADPLPTVDETSPRELEDTDYFFLGAMARGVIIPGFIQGLFVQGGIDGFNPGLGLSFNYRRNNFNVIAQAWWNNAAGDGYFRADGDPDNNTEFVDVDLGAFFLNAAFLWSFPLDSDGIIAIEAGFDIGFGIVYGDLVRTEATPDGDGYRPCAGPGDPTASPGYCEPPAPDPCYNRDGGHYDCREANWTEEGGDVPIIVPWVSLPHLAVRIKPIRQVQIRIDGGYGIYNFYFGGSVSYGF